MSLKDNVNTIIAMMGEGKIIEAVERFYADDVAMQENSNEPHVGKAKNIEREKQFLATIKEWQSLDVHSIGTDGDENDGVALIEYSFSFINTDDQPVKYEQVSVQRWKDGKIAHERFYYNAG